MKRAVLPVESRVPSLRGGSRSMSETSIGEGRRDSAAPG
jgi:hypothetical protein